MNDLAPVGRFTKCPTYMPRETAQGYLGRLVAFFGYASPKAFCDDFMLDNRGIQHGEPEALRPLAMITGADFDEMCRWTPKRLTATVSQLNGDAFPRQMIARTQIRICPACGLEDMAAMPGAPIDQAVYIRAEWTIGLVDRCFRHDVKLIEHRSTNSTIERIDVGYELLSLLEQIHELPQEHSQIDLFQRYVLGRIGVLPAIPSPLLDVLDISSASQVCVNAGSDLLKRRGLPSGNRMARRSAGFEVLGYGMEGLERAFLELREGHRLADMAGKIFPRLCAFLSTGERLQRGTSSITDAVADVCFRNLPYAQGDVLMGRTCPQRHLYDFNSAMAHYEIGSDRLYAFVVGTPELSAYRTERRQDTLIRAQVADRLFVGRTPFTTSHGLMRQMGQRSAHAFRDLTYLEEAGILAREPGACPTTAPPFYSVPGFELDKQRFIDRYELVDASRPQMRDVHSLVMMFRTTKAQLWKLLVSEKVRSLGLAPGTGFLNILRFDENEVAEAVTGLESPIGRRRAAELLRVEPDTLSKLVARGALCPDVSFTDGGPGPVHFFSPRTIEQFQAEYLRVFKEKLVVDDVSMVAHLKRRGVQPAIVFENKNHKGRSITFYRSSDVYKVMAELKSL